MTIQFAFNITPVVSYLALANFLTNHFSFSLSPFTCPLLLPGLPLFEVFNPARLFTEKSPRGGVNRANEK